MAAPHVLVRRIDLTLWKPVENFGETEVPAVLVQHKKELVAKDNALSFWRFDTGERRWLDDAILAVVGGWDRVDGVHVSWFPEETLTGVHLVCTVGNTCFPALRPKHRDAVALDGHRLALVAEQLAAAARGGTCVATKTREEVVDLVFEAVTSRKMLNRANLPQKLKDAVNERDR